MVVHPPCRKNRKKKRTKEGDQIVAIVPALVLGYLLACVGETNKKGSHAVPCFIGHTYMFAGRIKKSHISVGWNFYIPLNNVAKHPPPTSRSRLWIPDLGYPGPSVSDQFPSISNHTCQCLPGGYCQITLLSDTNFPLSTKKINSSMNVFTCQCLVLN